MARSLFRASKWKFHGNGGRTKLKSVEEFGEEGFVNERNLSFAGAIGL